MNNKVKNTLNIVSLVCLIGCVGAVGYSHLTKYGYINSISFNNKNISNNSLLTGEEEPTNLKGSIGDSYINLSTYDYYVKEESGWIKKGNIKGEKGNNGLNGNNGQDGQDGNDGKDGSDGKNGTSLLTGNEIPSNTLGSIGDSYINTSTFDYYIKNESGWNKIGNIKGSKGDTGYTGSSGSNGKDGKDGSQILTGLGAPSTSLGSIGDYYLDSNSKNLYKKSSSGWEVVVSLDGSASKGDKGDDGSQIYIGNEPSSSNNNDILIKSDGSLWKKINGIWVDQGVSLKGSKGDTGIAGSAGQDGSRGTGIYTGSSLPNDKSSFINGDLFILSSTGEVYKYNGSEFIDLNYSLKGETGVKGDSLLTNNGVPDSSLGNNGDTCINTLTGEIYSKVNGTWTSLNISLSTNKTNIGKGEPTSTSNNNGDIYIDENTGIIYVYDSSSSSWKSKDFTLKGERGNKIFKGESDPSSTTSYIDGDIYINTLSGDLFSFDNSNSRWDKIMSLKGSNGNSLLTGNGEPSSTLGNEGDSYIDLSSFKLYTKSSSGWSAGISFKGSDGSNGSNGKDGTSIYSGNTIPQVNDSTYKVNDLYLDTVTGKLYKYEFDSSLNSNKWNELMTIKGNDGSKGDKGDAGETAYSSTILPSSNGYVSVNLGSQIVGGNITFNVIPDTNYKCTSFTLNGTQYVDSLVDNSFTTAMVKNGFVVSAKFEKINEDNYANKTYYYYNADGTQLTQSDSSLSYYDGDWDALVDKYYSVNDNNTSDDTSDDTVTMWAGWNKEVEEVNETTCSVKYSVRTVTIPLSKNGVYPSSVINGKTISDTLGIKNNAIKWRYVSEDSDGNTQFVSEYLIGNEAFDTNNSNKYENSSIRTLLNGTYLNEMRSNLKDQPLIVTIDNTAGTTDSNSNTHISNNTNDKLYLLSYKDYLNPEYGFENIILETNKREAKLLVGNTTSDTTYTSGSNYWYWTRSPVSNFNDIAWDVGEEGTIDNYYCNKNRGVRPACTMNLKEYINK